MKQENYRLIHTKGILFIFVFLLSTAFLSTPFSQWVLKSSGITNPQVLSILSKGNRVFAGTHGSGVFVSSDNGENWVQTSLNTSTVRALIAVGQNIYAGTLGNSLYISTDEGLNWEQKMQTVQGVTCFSTDGSKIYAGTNFYGLHLSEDNGATWNRVSFNLNFVNSVLWRPGKMFVGGHFIFEEGLYESTDGGVMWNPTVIDYTLVNTLADNGTRIFAGTDSMGVLISDDDGLSWTQTTLTTQNVTDIYVFENYIFAGTFQGGLFVSHNNGMNWEPKNGGLAVNSLENITKHFKYIFLATRGGVYRTHLNEILGVQPVSNVIPGRFELFQNYPNPFNPSTTIRFDIPASSIYGSGNVKLVIFDAIGKEVGALVDENLSPGSYEVNWNASGYPSGVYFYRLEAGDFSAIKKLILVK